MRKILELMHSKKKDINFLLFGGLVMSCSIELSGLHERVSLRALIFFGSNPKWFNLKLLRSANMLFEQYKYKYLLFRLEVFFLFKEKFKFVRTIAATK